MARRRPSQPMEDWVEGFVLVVFRRRRVLVLRLVAFAMAFKNVRNLLLINHNDAFIDDDGFVVLYDSTFRMIRTRNLTWKSSMSLRVLQSFALEDEIYEF